jgi:hypothetical protein
MAYLYRHVRLHLNIPFYIGIGSDSEGEYKRANSKKGRSYSWKDIVKNIDWKVDILIDDISWDEACLKEIEFIKLYGRKDLGEGPLVNFTNGGEGQYGRKDSIETKLKKKKPKSNTDNMKKSHQCRDYSYLKGKAGAKSGVKKSLIHTEKIQLAANNKKIKIWCPELNMIFNSLTEAGKILNRSSGSISNVLKSKTHKTKSGLTLLKIS